MTSQLSASSRAEPASPLACASNAQAIIDTRRIASGSHFDRTIIPGESASFIRNRTKLSQFLYFHGVSRDAMDVTLGEETADCYIHVYHYLIPMQIFYFCNDCEPVGQCWSTVIITGAAHRATSCHLVVFAGVVYFCIPVALEVPTEVLTSQHNTSGVAKTQSWNSPWMTWPDIW